MIKNRKSILEARISRLERLMYNKKVKNEAADPMINKAVRGLAMANGSLVDFCNSYSEEDHPLYKQCLKMQKEIESMLDKLEEMA